MRNSVRKIIVDTNIWIAFLKTPNELLKSLLKKKRIEVHSSIIGELCVGNLPRKPLIRELLVTLPRPRELELAEALHFLDVQKLNRRGLQWNDVLILGSASVNGSLVWTNDKRLAEAARDLGISFAPDSDQGSESLEN